MHTSHHASGSHYIEVDLPLSPDTRNAEQVADLVATFLRHIESLDRSRPVARDDVIQALSITAAIQWARREAEARCGSVDLSLERIEVADAIAEHRRAA
jgi:hypothetical protein